MMYCNSVIQMPCHRKLSRRYSWTTGIWIQIHQWLESSDCTRQQWSRRKYLASSNTMIHWTKRVNWSDSNHWVKQSHCNSVPTPLGLGSKYWSSLPLEDLQLKSMLFDYWLCRKLWPARLRRKCKGRWMRNCQVAARRWQLESNMFHTMAEWRHNYWWSRSRRSSKW